MPQRLSFEHNLHAAWPGLWGGVRVLVAVSGGADSVALLRALARLATAATGTLTVAHFNHRLRGAASDEDELFVAALAKSLKLDFEVGRGDLALPNRMPDGIEAAARQARYQFLTKTAERIGARYVVTGHTADDQAETMLHHIVRGTGLSGLAGMRRVRLLTPAVTLMRPMLELRRADVVAYLAELKQTHRDDATNADRRLTRNRIRHELLPLLGEEYSPAIVDSLLRLGALAGDAQQLIESLAESTLEKMLLSRDERQVILACSFVPTIPPHLLREVFVAIWRKQDWPRQAMGWDQWNQLAELAAAESGPDRAPLMLPGAIRAQKAGETLVLARS